MGFRAAVILDSIGPNGKRLTSVEMTYPRFIHAEFMTHRDRARNAASSRAIPWKKAKPGKTEPKEIEDLIDKCMLKMIMTDPVIPISFDVEQKGMQSGAALSESNQRIAKSIWLEARDYAAACADRLAEMGVHKSICNRLTEPFMWITVLCTATEWNNFFRLRCHPAAEKHFQLIAGMVRDVIANSKPQPLTAGEWHLPYIKDNELYDSFGMDEVKKISVGRCARLSYLTHDGKRDPIEDIKLCEKLIKPPGDPDEEVMHASPFEHVAEACSEMIRSGPFIGWKQYRKEFPNENLSN